MVVAIVLENIVATKRRRNFAIFLPAIFFDPKWLSANIFMFPSIFYLNLTNCTLKDFTETLYSEKLFFVLCSKHGQIWQKTWSNLAKSSSCLYYVSKTMVWQKKSFITKVPANNATNQLFKMIIQDSDNSPANSFTFEFLLFSRLPVFRCPFLVFSYSDRRWQ